MVALFRQFLHHLDSPIWTNDKWIDWLIDNFRLKRMLYMIRDSCLAD